MNDPLPIKASLRQTWTPDSERADPRSGSAHAEPWCGSGVAPAMQPIRPPTPLANGATSAVTDYVPQPPTDFVASGPRDFVPAIPASPADFVPADSVLAAGPPAPRLASLETPIEPSRVAWRPTDDLTIQTPAEWLPPTATAPVAPPTRPLVPGAAAALDEPDAFTLDRDEYDVVASPPNVGSDAPIPRSVPPFEPEPIAESLTRTPDLPSASMVELTPVHASAAPIPASFEFAHTTGAAMDATDALPHPEVDARQRAATDGARSVTMVVYPFTKFGSLNQFIAAVDALPSVRRSTPRRFRRGTLQLAVDTGSEDGFREELAQIIAFRPRVVSEDDDTLMVAVENA